MCKTHISDHIKRNAKSIAMPLAMLCGAVMCRPIAGLDQLSEHMITPILIFAMLFVTFCRVTPKQMKFSGLHVWMLSFQLIVSGAIYLTIKPFDPIVAQGAMICVLTPVAMAAVVIGGMLGANLASMVTYSLLSNVVIGVAAPFILAATGSGVCDFTQIMARVAPLLIMPFAAAQVCRFLAPRAAKWIGEHGQISFYMWLLALVVVIGRTTVFITDLRGASFETEIWLAVVALVLCISQFAIGRALGRRYGDAVAGGQSLGQKNTILAIWMAQSFLNPICSIAPTAYIVWQNFVNSYQLWKKGRDGRVKQL